MKRLFIISAICLFSLSVAYAQGGKMATSAKAERGSMAVIQEKTLYQRLGGYDALAAVSDEFLVQLGKSKLLGRFVVGLNDNSKKKLRQHLVDFLCSATGGPCLYLGQDMKTAHTGLGITEADWNEGVKALVATLDKYKVPAKEKGEVLGAVGGLKKDIVEKP
jgi:hemoglobin